MTPHNITHNNTHKNRMITSFINRFALICVIASTAVLTACIGNESKESLYDFSSRTFVLPSGLSSQAAAGGTNNEPSNIALRYLESIGFDKYERKGRVVGRVFRGSDFDGSNDRLGAEDGFLIVYTRGENGDGGHAFAGRFDTTNVGNELIAAPPVATFSGRAHVVIVHARDGGLFSTNNSIISEITFNNLNLTVNFDDKTLIGSDSNGLGTLNVNGRFSGRNLSGSVITTFTNDDVMSAASRDDFTSNLEGQIGEDGAVGVFNNHLARGRPSDRAFSGGFIVKAPPASP